MISGKFRKTGRPENQESEEEGVEVEEYFSCYFSYEKKTYTKIKRYIIIFYFGTSLSKNLSKKRVLNKVF
jgi:hypothetical protein